MNMPLKHWRTSVTSTEREKIISLANQCGAVANTYETIFAKTADLIDFYKAAQNEAITEYEKKLHKEQLDRVAQIRPEKYMLMNEKENE